ncbi:unnamed protein product [marine sediment metagenome]|uniref:Uncharacterized protein n=1 Tax=marine sediment metagenome TaxID=412755 RepID=X0W464_9ZZZZ
MHTYIRSICVSAYYKRVYFGREGVSKCLNNIQVIWTFIWAFGHPPCADITVLKHLTYILKL